MTTPESIADEALDNTWSTPNLDAFTMETPSLAFHDHDTTLRLVAQQEREDAAGVVARLYELHLRARLRLEEALRAGATAEAKALTIHEARLDSARTHHAWEFAEHDLLGAAKYGEAWPEKRAQYRRDGAGPFASRFAGETIEIPTVEQHTATLEPILKEGIRRHYEQRSPPIQVSEPQIYTMLEEVKP